MRLWGIVVLAAALAGCAASEQQVENLNSAWAACIGDAVARMDDGKTDPVSLAYGIAPQCAGSYQRFSEAEVSNYITENGQRAQRQLWRDKELQMVTSAILIHRTKGKASPSALPAQ
jgi:hypothetical protein